MDPDEPVDPRRKADRHRFADQVDASFARELFDWVRTGRKWWLLPVLAVVITLGAVLLMGSSVAAPFIYTFF